MHGHHSALAVYTAQRRFYNPAALIESQLKGYALCFEIAHGLFYSVTKNLLVVTGGYVEIAGRDISVAEQLLHRGELSEQRCFCVHGASAPDDTVINLTERLVAPLARRRDNIVMRHEQDIP